MVNLIVSFRITEQEKALIEKYLIYKGQDNSFRSMSEFFRRAIIYYIQNTTEKGDQEVLEKLETYKRLSEASYYRAKSRLIMKKATILKNQKKTLKDLIKQGLTSDELRIIGRAWMEEVRGIGLDEEEVKKMFKSVGVKL